MSKIRYLLDENINPVLRSALLKRDANLVVWQIGMLGVPDFGTLDPEILIWCEENNFDLVRRKQFYFSNAQSPINARSSRRTSCRKAKRQRNFYFERKYERRRYG